MSKRMPIFYGAMMLTGVNLLLRFVATSFQVYLSGAIGAAGIGLIQLVISVSALAMTLGLGGIRTTAMYLCAEDLGRGRREKIPGVISGCFLYCAVTGGTVCLALYAAAPWIAGHWLGEPAAVPALRTAAAFLPVACLCGVMTGFFTAGGRIGTLAVVETAEQLVCMGFTVLALLTVPEGDIAGSCRAVVLGTSCGYCLTLGCLLFLYKKEFPAGQARFPVAKRIVYTALPLALADDLKAGISALENLMVPRRLALFPGIGNPLAAFGMVTGMVFPVMMFPSAILFSLAELLIPELARCAAVGSRERISYLVGRNIRAALLYGLVFGGGMFLLAEPLCGWLYPGVAVSGYLRRFSLLVPMLYCDLIVDAMTKGLGQQKTCVKYNIISNSLDVCLLFVLLPRYGVAGYFASFLLTHALNFILSYRRLVKIGKPRDGFSMVCLALTAWLVALFGATRFSGEGRQMVVFLGLFFCVSYAFGVWRREDLQWIRGLLIPEKNPERT